MRWCLVGGLSEPLIAQITLMGCDGVLVGGGDAVM